MKQMIGKKYVDAKLKKVNIVSSIATLTCLIKVHPRGQGKPIDPLALFQRICLLSLSRTVLRKYFAFELAPFAMALFDELGMRKGTKSDLYDLFVSINESLNRGDEYVIDGGFLIHRLVWPKNKTYNEIAMAYVQYVDKHFGPQCDIVFDGYRNVGLKSAEHFRRYHKQAPDIVIMRSLFRGATNSHEGQLHATPLKSTPDMCTRS